MKTSTRSGRSLRRFVTLGAMGAMVMALVPMGQAAATDTPPPRETNLVCPEVDDMNDPYTDVSPQNTHYRNILCATHHDIAEGFLDDTFRTSNNTLRDQMASFIVRWVEEATGETLPGGDNDRFDDVPTDEESPRYPHNTNINKLAEAGIVLGRTEDRYFPRAPVTRDQMASFIGRAISYVDNGDPHDGPEPPFTAHAYFTDVPADNDHRNAINALAEVGIAVGYEDSTEYGPRDFVRRDQMTSFILRGWDYLVEQGITEPPFEPAPVAGPHIVSAELDTRDVALDTPEIPFVAEGDEWVITFSETMDTPDFATQEDTPEQGTTVDLVDDDGEAFTVECVAEAGDEASDEDFVAAVCSFDNDERTVLRLVIDDVTAMEFEYPVTITDIDLLTTEDGEEISIEDSEDLVIGEEVG